MGLDVSHDCFSGAYSAFENLRHHIIMYSGRLPPGDAPRGHFSLSDEAADILEKAAIGDPHHLIGRHVYFRRWWQFYKKRCILLFNRNDLARILEIDPLALLLWHSDCGGILPKRSCRPIANCLYEIAPKIPLEERGSPHIERGGGLRDCVIKFADGLMKAHQSGEYVIFQ